MTLYRVPHADELRVKCWGLCDNCRVPELCACQCHCLADAVDIVDREEMTA